MSQPEHSPSSNSQRDTDETLGHYTDTEWDITNGVGFTALAVAAGRAMETHRPDPLITDTQAGGFVEAVHARGDGPGTVLPTGWPPHTASLAASAGVDEDELTQLWTTMATYQGVRSRFFDQYFRTAVDEAGIRQVVLLAAGLDTRAHRLSWPSGTHLFEIDHPNVLTFKDRVLSEQQAQPDCHRHAVGVDLRDDWPTALDQTGFDPHAPTAWLAEGLLFFLPDEAKQLLCQRVHELSASGSQWAIESMADPSAAMQAMQNNTVLQRISAQFGADPSGLWPPDQRWEPHAWLLNRGWTVTTASAHTVAARYDRTVNGPAPMAEQNHPSVLLTAVCEHPRNPGTDVDAPPEATQSATRHP